MVSGGEEEWRRKRRKIFREGKCLISKEEGQCRKIFDKERKRTEENIWGTEEIKNGKGGKCLVSGGEQDQR